MTRDHLLGFPALLRQHDEPAAPKKPTVVERPAAFVAFETGDWAPKMTVGVDPAVEGGDKRHHGDAAGDIVEYRVVVKKAKQGSISAKF